MTVVPKSWQKKLSDCFGRWWLTSGLKKTSKVRANLKNFDATLNANWIDQIHFHFLDPSFVPRLQKKRCQDSPWMSLVLGLKGVAWKVFSGIGCIFPTSLQKTLTFNVKHTVPQRIFGAYCFHNNTKCMWISCEDGSSIFTKCYTQLRFTDKLTSWSAFTPIGGYLVVGDWNYYIYFFLLPGWVSFSHGNGNYKMVVYFAIRQSLVVFWALPWSLFNAAKYTPWQ